MLSLLQCFSMEMSGAFALLGFLGSWWLYSKTSNLQLAGSVFFFFTMEFLQFIQYFFIADTYTSPECELMINKVLTAAGFLHICLQPYFAHNINYSLTRSKRYLFVLSIMKKLALLGGAFMWLRFMLSYVPGYTTMDFKREGVYASTEWVRGEKLCTFRGNLHLAWSIPMAEQSYFLPGIGIHMFCMFAPFFAMYQKKGMVLQGLFLFLFGPFMASLFTSNLMEQASIWCFFSIAQIGIMLFCIREGLIQRWGVTPDTSLLQKGQVAPTGSAREAEYDADFDDEPMKKKKSASKTSSKKKGSKKAE